MGNTAQLANLSGAYAAGGISNFKNRIINGGMVIDQRNAGASYTQVNGLYNLDRWAGNTYNGGAATNKFSVQRSTTAPTGFSNSMLVTSLSASATTTSDIYNIEQKIEGFNTSDLMFGTANAATITLSFWVRSSLTGTFGGAIKNESRNRAYPFTYTINSANTFEYKTITIPGDQSGTWTGGTNGTGIYMSFGLGVGSSFSGSAGAWAAGDLFSATGAQHLISNNAATWYITGVQLEKGSTATSFDYRPYGTELQLCQRYYQHISSSASSGNYMPYGTGLIAASTYGFVQIPILVAFRSAPTLTNATVSQFRFGFTTCTALAMNSPSANTVSLRCDVASGLTTGQAAQLDSNNNQTSYIGLSAEL